MTTYVIYGDTSDFGIGTPTGQTWAQARSGVNASADSSSSTTFRAAASSGYYVNQGMIGFNTSACDSGTASSVSITLAIYYRFKTTTTVEIAEHDWTAASAASFVAGDDLGSKTLFGSKSISANGSHAFTSSLTSIPVSSLYKLVVYDQRQRTNTTPTANNDIYWYSADQSGTTQDPKLTFDVTAGGGGGTTYDETVSESVTPGTSTATAATFGASLSESVTPSGTQACAAMFAPSLAEAITAAATTSAGLVIASSLSKRSPPQIHQRRR